MLRTLDNTGGLSDGVRTPLLFGNSALLKDLC